MMHRGGASLPALGRAQGLVAAFAACVLAGCVAYSPKDLRIGDREATVLATLGAPTARHQLPDGGARLVYARGPMGRHTYMVDLGPEGGVKQWKQVLGELEFEDIHPGWTMEQVLREFGPPADRRPYRPNGGQIWSYRYPTFECRWFQLTFDPAGVVDAASYGIDPMCDDGAPGRRRN